MGWLLFYREWPCLLWKLSLLSSAHSARVVLSLLSFSVDLGQAFFPPLGLFLTFLLSFLLFFPLSLSLSSSSSSSSLSSSFDSSPTFSLSLLVPLFFHRSHLLSLPWIPLFLSCYQLLPHSLLISPSYSPSLSFLSHLSDALKYRFRSVIFDFPLHYRS